MIAKVVFNLGVEKEFDYFSSEVNLVGKRVLVELNKKKLVGVVIKETKKTNVKNIKEIKVVLDEASPTLTREQLRFVYMLRRYYPYSLGELTFIMIPSLLRSSKRLNIESRIIKERRVSRRKKECIFLKEANPYCRLEIYKKKIASTLKNGSVIFCVPTSSHLKIVYKDLEKKFSSKIALLYSQQKRKEFFSEWLKIKEGKKLILGTRTAIFYFPEDLELIILDEEISPFYFHPEKPFYRAPEVAYLLCQMKKIDLILGGDFPSLEMFKMIREGKIKLVDKKKKITFSSWKILEAKDIISKRQSLKVNPLIIEILRKTKEEGKRVAIFYPRGGFSLYLRCANCGYLYFCPKRCAPLRYSQEKNELVCPFCGYREEAPSSCRKCSSSYLKPEGVGMERISFYFRRFFPQLKTSLERKDFLLVTYSNLDTSFWWENSFSRSLVLNPHLLLSLLDFEATFRLYIYLNRIRYLTREEVIIFRQFSYHYLWESLDKNWLDFYKKELQLRKKARLPPFIHLAKLTLRAKNKDILLQKAERICKILKKNDKLEVFGPLKEYPFNKLNKFYYSIVVKAARRKVIFEEIKKIFSLFRRGTTKLAVVIR